MNMNTGQTENLRLCPTTCFHKKRRRNFLILSGVMMIFLIVAKQWRISGTTLYVYNDNSEFQADEGVKECNLTHAAADPFNPDVLPYLKNASHIDCSSAPYPPTYVKNSRLYVNDSLTSGTSATSCTYQYIRRPPNWQVWKRDHDIQYSSPTSLSLSPPIPVTLTEDFVYTECVNASKDVVAAAYHALLSDTTVLRVLEKYPDLPPEVPNVLIFALDSMSEKHAWRGFPKTMAWMKAQRNATVLKGYHKIGDNSFPNTLAFMGGVTSEVEFKGKKSYIEYLRPWSKEFNHLDDLRFVWTDFKDKGYVTVMEEGGSGQLSGPSAGFFFQPVELYMRPFMFAIKKKPKVDIWNQSPEHCFGRTPIHRLLMDWMKDVFRQFQFHNRRFFLFQVLMEFVHDTLAIPEQLDEDFLEQLKFLDEVGMLKNSFVFLSGDHGMRFGPYRSQSLHGVVEDNMPLLAISAPDWFAKKFPTALESLRQNEWRLASHFDFWATLKAICDENYVKENPKSGRGPISLFTDIPKKRSCEQAGVGRHFCTCDIGYFVSQNHTSVIKAANAAVKFINNKAKHHMSNLCVPLGLKTVVMSSAIKTSNESLPFDVLRLSFKTKPGDGFYEATLRWSDNVSSWVVQDELSRFDRYAPQVKCLNKDLRPVEKYCLCKSFWSNLP